MEEFEGVFGVANGFGGPEVGVVGDAAVFVGGDGLAFHDPFEGGLAVDDVVVGGEGDVFEGDALVVDDGGFVVDAFAGLRVAGFGELHFGDPVVGVGQGVGGGLAGVEGDAGVEGYGFVVQVPMGEIAAGLGEGAEVSEGFDGGDAREFLAEVVGVAAAVVGGMQQAVDVIEKSWQIRISEVPAELEEFLLFDRFRTRRDIHRASGHGLISDGKKSRGGLDY